MIAKVIIESIRAKKKSFILIAALFLVDLSFYLYASVYQAPRLENLQNQWFAKRKSTTVDAAQDPAAIYRQGEGDLKLWRARIIPKKGFARFVANLFETAANNSLAFKGVTYKAGQVKNEDLMTYTLDFNVTGKYAAVKSFLADLGRMHEILTVDNIALAHSKTSEDAPDAVSLRVQLTLYLRMVE